MDAESGLAEGALTVLCGRRHPSPTALAAQVDALAAIHRRWSSETGGRALFSLPLKDSQGTVAIVSLRPAADRLLKKMWCC